MLTVHNVLIIIIAFVYFSYTTSDCISGTSEGCPNGTACFLNVCYQSRGPCSDGKCDTGFICVNATCLNISAPTTTSTTKITSATTTTTTTTETTTATITTTTQECVDRSAPGRTSDCPRAKYLCNNPVYYELMTQQCPFTCGRCEGSRQKPACTDRTAADGTSNCASVAYLCGNSLYRQLMIEQCPRTCKFC